MNKNSPPTAAAARELAAKRRLDPEGALTATPLPLPPRHALELARAVLGELVTPKIPAGTPPGKPGTWLSTSAAH